MSLDALLSADFKTPPRKQQAREFELHCDEPARALLWHMRTGKTKAAIDKACYRYKLGKIDAVLILAPNGVHANWLYRELPRHCWPSVTPQTLCWASTLTGVLSKSSKKGSAEQSAFWKTVGDFKKKRGFLWFAVNSESMTRADVRRAIARFIKHRRILLIVDECDDFGTPGSKRSKMARGISHHVAEKIIMSGTAGDGSPLATFSQFELLARSALGYVKYSDFKSQYSDWVTETTQSGRQFPKFDGYKNLDELRERIAKWSSVVTRDDADMPDLEFETVDVQPTDKQREVYRDLRATFITELRDKEVSIGEQTMKLIKLQQVFSGFLVDEYKERHLIPGKNPRLAALIEQAAMAKGKCIIWANFQFDMDVVAAALRKLKFGVVEVHGRVSNTKKEANRKAFNEDRNVKFLVGHPQAGGRGYDLSAASTIMFYSHGMKARLRRQAIERASEEGGKNIRIMDFVAPGPDKYILKLTQDHIDIADDLVGRGLQAVLKGLRL